MQDYRELLLPSFIVRRALAGAGLSRTDGGKTPVTDSILKNVVLKALLCKNDLKHKGCLSPQLRESRYKRVWAMASVALREEFWQAYGSTAPKLDVSAPATDNDSREHYSLSSGNIMIPVAAIEMGTLTIFVRSLAFDRLHVGYFSPIMKINFSKLIK